MIWQTFECPCKKTWLLKSHKNEIEMIEIIEGIKITMVLIILKG